MVKKNGFSLIELLIVIAILGIVLGIAGPNFIKYRENSNLKEVARDFSSDFLLYKQRASAENIHYRISFNMVANSYSVLKETALNSNIFNNVVTKQVGGDKPVVITAIGGFGGNSFVDLQPRGTASAAGSLTLMHTNRLSTSTIALNVMGRTNVTYSLK